MNTDLFSFDRVHPLSHSAAHPIEPLATRLGELRLTRLPGRLVFRRYASSPPRAARQRPARALPTEESRMQARPRQTWCPGRRGVAAVTRPVVDACTGGPGRPIAQCLAWAPSRLANNPHSDHVLHCCDGQQHIVGGPTFHINEVESQFAPALVHHVDDIDLVASQHR
mgnify:CR=1 FL=1